MEKSRIKNLEKKILGKKRIKEQTGVRDFDEWVENDRPAGNFLIVHKTLKPSAWAEEVKTQMALSDAMKAKAMEKHSYMDPPTTPPSKLKGMSEIERV